MRPAAIVFPNLILLLVPFLAAGLSVGSPSYWVLFIPIIGLVINMLLLAWAAHHRERGLRTAATILALLWSGLGLLIWHDPPFPHF